MKKILGVLAVLVVILLGLSACGSSGESDDIAIDVKGCFFLEPGDELKTAGIDDENLQNGEKYFFVVYDVINDSDKNIEISGFDDAVTVNFNGTNEYTQTSGFYDTPMLCEFLDYCGYQRSEEVEKMLGGSEPIRMIEPFIINEKDMKEDVTAEIDFSLSNELTTEKEFTSEDIQSISLFDEVFKVEDDYEAYQIAQSVPRRAVLANNAMQLAVDSFNNGNIATKNISLATMMIMFSTDAPGGISVGKFTMSEELPVFDINAVKTIYPDIADEVETLIADLNYIYKEMSKSNFDVDAANNKVDSARKSITAIKEFYHIDD